MSGFLLADKGCLNIQFYCDAFLFTGKMSKSARDELKGFFHSENNSSDLISLCFSQICVLFSAIVYMSRDYLLDHGQIAVTFLPFEAFFQLLHFLDGEIYSRSHKTFTFAIKKKPCIYQIKYGQRTARQSEFCFGRQRSFLHRIMIKAQKVNMYFGKCLERRTNDWLKDRCHFELPRKSVKFYCVEFHPAIYLMCNMPSSF